MNKEINFSNELEINKEKIALELKKGNDIMIKSTDKGIKVQSINVRTIK